MKMRAGLWIDHKKALIVLIIDGKEKMLTVQSDFEKILRPEGGECESNIHGRSDFPKYDIDERDIKGHLNNYLDKVINLVRDVESVYILGPGGVKGELAKRIEKSGFKGQISAVENAEKMTDPQLIAKVKKYFKID